MRNAAVQKTSGKQSDVFFSVFYTIYFKFIFMKKLRIIESNKADDAGYCNYYE